MPCTVWDRVQPRVSMVTNAFGVESHITGVDCSALKASLDKNWTFNHQRSSYLPGHSTTPLACQLPSLVRISVWRFLWSLSSTPLPHGPFEDTAHHPHADLDYKHRGQTKTHLSLYCCRGMGKAVKGFGCQKDLGVRLWDVILGKFVNIT